MALPVPNKPFDCAIFCADTLNNLEGPAQLPEEALDRVRFGGVGWLHHPGRVHGLPVLARVAPGPVPGSAAQTPRMRAISSPVMFFCQAHHSRPVMGSMATATWVYFQPIRTAWDTATPRGAHTLHTWPRSPTRISSPHTMLQADRLQACAEPLFFQAARARGSACGWRGRGTFSRIPSRGSSVYMLSRV